MNVHFLLPGFDDVRSLTVHVCMFISIFWAAIDVYASILHAQLVGTSAFGRIVVFTIYALVCFFTVLFIWPAYYGNHSHYSAKWLIVTGSLAAGISAARVWWIVSTWADMNSFMRTIRVIQTVFVVVTFVATAVLGVKLAENRAATAALFAPTVCLSACSSARFAAADSTLNCSQGHIPRNSVYFTLEFREGRNRGRGGDQSRGLIQ